MTVAQKQAFDRTPPHPIILRPDNFTPVVRTPWGGTRILEKYKRSAISRLESAETHVGESWEISVEPDFPSRCARTGALLSERMQEDLPAWLGNEAADGRTSTALLVKLLDAQQALSVQIHPADDYAGLSLDESGKPESWYVLDADDGAGLYLGLRPGATRDEVERALACNEDVSRLLYFTEVAPGDFFVIDAGTPHAIGAGVTLVEPQRVVPKKRGVTYRFWDWNRRYDTEGQVGPKGEPRALHVAHALSVTNWSGPRGEDLLNKICYRSGALNISESSRLRHLCGPQNSVLSFPYLGVSVIDGTGPIQIPASCRLAGLTVVCGVVRIALSGGEETVVPCGYSAAIPADMRELNFTLQSAHALICSAF